MKLILLSIFLNLSFIHANASFFEETDIFMSRYVSEGKVDYDRILDNSYELDQLIDRIENTTLKLSPKIDQKAFYINAYNVLVIKGIVDHYPIKSPLDVDGFFDKIKYSVAGEQLTLNEIENEKIRKQYDDPRIHFALVCAAVSCPKLIPEAYFPSELNRQLKERTKKSINDEEFIRVDSENKKVKVSQIFKWYAEDFEGEKNVIPFINKYRDKEIPSDYSLAYYEYDWTLNGKK